MTTPGLATAPDVKKTPTEGTALCLSGGGYRAALFHLGALRRLIEIGMLSKVDAITSVSGGSILSAHVAHVLVKKKLPLNALNAPVFEEHIAKPFRQFASLDIRTAPVLKRFLLPWNWVRRDTQVNALIDQYHDNLTNISLTDLPDVPKFIFCATELACGVNWVFEKTRVGDYQVGYQSPPPTWSLAKAVAASSCFPPVFDPMAVEIEPKKLSGGSLAPGQETDQILSNLRLSDGGVYDNLGVEPAWGTYRTILVSDGGAPFTLDVATTVIRQWKRYFDIAGNQVAALRKRWLISSYQSGDIAGTYWGIGSATTRYDESYTRGYSKKLAQEIIARIRTDLDGFSQPEMMVLENHGYLLVDAAVRKHMPEHSLATGEPPFPDWMDETKVRRELADSHKRIRF